VISPSSSKTDDNDDYFQEGDDLGDYDMNPDDISRSDVSVASIPMAHREYEKILR